MVAGRQKPAGLALTPYELRTKEKHVGSSHGWMVDRHRYSPIGVDIGNRSVKLLQFDAECRRVTDGAGSRRCRSGQSRRARRRGEQGPPTRKEGAGIPRTRAVFCLGAGNLFVLSASPCSRADGSSSASGQPGAVCQGRGRGSLSKRPTCDKQALRREVICWPAIAR